MENTSILDVVSIAAILIYGIKGYFKGFSQEVLGLVGVLGGFYLALKYGGDVGEMINNALLHLDNKTILPLIGSIIILISTWLVTRTIGIAVGKFLNSHGLGVINKILGFLIGGGKVVIVFSLLVHLLTSIPFVKDTVDNALKGGIMYPYFKSVSSVILSADNADLTKKIEAPASN